ncbi:hypothetical protein TSOC_002887 [Tetrabaena socialis]|uniref:Protease n=1 Tax=Tetrabaena socialis TaxID=47790 RepID=A0A2J8AD01_9CHLO|nr:hypothetical protein TSOC_002887 [Tetrabaena socialis]|eukprot:PNH10386.1 hypothetical protein TSOC_002887 [Tetrabaena socialis]
MQARPPPIPSGSREPPRSVRAASGTGTGPGASGQPSTSGRQQPISAQRRTARPHGTTPGGRGDPRADPRRQAATPQPQERAAGYSAGDAPERRKNPELYAGLQPLPPRGTLDPLTTPRPAGFIGVEDTAPTVATDEQEPAVTYMMSAPLPAPAAAAAPGAAAASGAAAAAAAAQARAVRLPHKPEVLSPAGGWPQLRAAVENGADAVYFGLEDFNARASRPHVPDLILAGVSCFKIEGRLKGPEYVALTTQAGSRGTGAPWAATVSAQAHPIMYRRAVDAAWSALASEQGGGEAAAAEAVALTEQQRWDLEQVFARGQDGTHRGLTPGFLEGVAHQQLVRGRGPRHRGVFLGRVEAVGPRGVVLELQPSGEAGPWRGLTRLAPTYDLHAGQMAALAAALGPRSAQLEAVVHQHLPIFHTEHCVFCRFLSSGNSYRDCGHPCETHRLHLRDDKGADHLVLADMGCRNTVFNAKAQSGVFYLRDLIRAGFRTVRLELVDEQPQFVAPLLEGYRDVILGRRGPGDLWRWLGTLPDANGAAHGVEAGSLTVHKERARGGMKPTAAALKEQQQQGQQGQGQAQQQGGGSAGAALAGAGVRRR